MSKVPQTPGRFFDRDTMIRDRSFLDSAAIRVCDVPGCPDREVVGHHILKGSGHGTGQKPSDADVLFLCGHHHTGPDGIHQYGGGEAMFVLREIVIPTARLRHRHWAQAGDIRGQSWLT